MNPHNKKQLYNSQVSPQLSGGGHTVNRKKIRFTLKNLAFSVSKIQCYIWGDLLNLAALIIKTFIGLHGVFLPDELSKNVP